MMSSRDKILAAIKNNQPDFRELPPLPGQVSGQGLTEEPAAGTNGPLTAATTAAASPEQLAARFIGLLEAIGGSAYIVSGFDRIASILREQHPDARRIVSGSPELASLAETATHYDDPHTLENIDLAILRAHFGVAENGACWITEDLMIERALPFIAQHLALVIYKKDIVANMHEAYERIAKAELGGTGYGFATFIAGPSKTADIEQSLVLGAHGPRSMTVFLLDEEMSDAGFY
jgi:L-lactate dehydrogenase complex protein LldG